MIREQDPLKQGLKLCCDLVEGDCVKIREQDPLKQGLKLPDMNSFIPTLTYSRARSTKTRIETSLIDTCRILPEDSRARSTKTRIETSRSLQPVWRIIHSRARSTKTRIETTPKKI